MNSITITGRVGRDPELRFTTAGKAIANFSVAVTRKAKDEEETTWFDCVAFGEQAEHYCASFPKGSRVIVIGRFEIKDYQNKDGEARKKHQIIVDEAGLSARWKNLLIDHTTSSSDAERVSEAFPSGSFPEEPF